MSHPVGFEKLAEPTHKQYAISRNQMALYGKLNKTCTHMPLPIDAVNQDALKLMIRSAQSSRLNQVPTRAFLDSMSMPTPVRSGRVCAC